MTQCGKSYPENEVVRVAKIEQSGKGFINDAEISE